MYAVTWIEPDGAAQRAAVRSEIEARELATDLAVLGNDYVEIWADADMPNERLVWSAEGDFCR